MTPPHAIIKWRVTMSDRSNMAEGELTSTSIELPVLRKAFDAAAQVADIALRANNKQEP